MQLSASVRALVAIVFLASGALVRAEGVFIAGLQPDVRPAGAPAIAAVLHDDDWQVKALTGVEPPAPESLRWLADQGEWFSPFIGPGMTGPYDLRGWHTAEAVPAQ
ncbi:MAG: hypothetical protein IPL47_01060 [Phyllobacteriaceae bacterium]|nr:hypothetical protein [Phyllobacteriaceae bacterium]